MATATYISSTEFSVEGDKTGYYLVGRMVRLSQGVDGTAKSAVASRAYNAGSDITEITVEDAVVTSNLETALRGRAQGDDNTQVHPHDGTAGSGGLIQDLVDLQAEVDALDLLPAPSVPTAKWLARVSPTGDAYEVVELEGTANRITVDDTSDPTKITLSTPQNIHAAATPTFAGLTLSGLTGIMEAKGATAVGIVATSTALHILRRNATGTAYEFAAVNLADLGDTLFTGLAAGDILYRNASSKWVNLVKPTDGAVLSCESGLPSWLIMALKNLSDVDASVTDSPTVGDMFYHDGSKWNLLVKPTDAGYFLGANVSTRVPEWKEPPGASGGEANTTSNDGGGVELAKTKDGIDLPFRTLNSSQFELATDIAQIKEIVLVGAAPDYTPPAIKYKDADEIYVPVGRYYKAGHRIRGQYQNPTGAYWDVAALTAVDIDGEYAAGSVSGMIGAAKVNSSWYSVFLMGDTGICQALPFVRVDTIAYGTPSTTITPAAHADGATAENGFILANDAWNGYRLVNITYDIYDGEVFTIADCTTATPDTIVITGDITAKVAAAGWLQLVPPAGTDCLYLGCIRIDGSGNLQNFGKHDWSYEIPRISCTLNLGTSYADSELSAAIPPTAIMAGGTMYATGTCTRLLTVLPTLSSDSDGRQFHQQQLTSGAHIMYQSAAGIPLSLVSKLRNKAIMNTGSWVAATDAQFQITDYSE